MRLRVTPETLRLLAAIALVVGIAMAVTVTWAAVRVIQSAPDLDRALVDADTATRNFNESARDIAPTLRVLRNVADDLGGGG